MRGIAGVLAACVVIAATSLLADVAEAGGRVVAFPRLGFFVAPVVQQPVVVQPFRAVVPVQQLVLPTVQRIVVPRARFVAPVQSFNAGCGALLLH